MIEPQSQFHDLFPLLSSPSYTFLYMSRAAQLSPPVPNLTFPAPLLLIELPEDNIFRLEHGAQLIHEDLPEAGVGLKALLWPRTDPKSQS